MVLYPIWEVKLNVNLGRACFLTSKAFKDLPRVFLESSRVFKYLLEVFQGIEGLPRDVKGLVS